MSSHFESEKWPRADKEEPLMSEGRPRLGVWVEGSERHGTQSGSSRFGASGAGGTGHVASTPVQAPRSAPSSLAGDPNVGACGSLADAGGNRGRKTLVSR